MGRFDIEKSHLSRLKEPVSDCMICQPAIGYGKEPLPFVMNMFINVKIPKVTMYICNVSHDPRIWKETQTH